MQSESILGNPFNFATLMWPFPNFQPREDDFDVFDWTGTRWEEGSFPRLPINSTHDLDVAKNGDGFRAGVNEWGAFLLAIHLAASEQIPNVIVELGCSQGLWCLPWIRLFPYLSVQKAYAIGIEAAPAQDDTIKFWEAQELNFDLIKTNTDLKFHGVNFDFHWLQRAVFSGQECVHFPNVQVSKDNGSRLDESLQLINNYVSVPTIDAFKINELVSNIDEESEIALLHIDIQGAETNLLASKHFGKLVSKTKILMVGTHSVQAEIDSFQILKELDFILISGSPSKYQYEPNPVLIEDGEQIWIRQKDLEIAQMKNLVSLHLNTEDTLISWINKVSKTRDTLLLKSNIAHSQPNQKPENIKKYNFLKLATRFSRKIARVLQS